MNENDRLLKGTKSVHVGEYTESVDSSTVEPSPAADDADAAGNWGTASRASVVYVCVAAFLYTLSSVGEPVRNIIMFKLACNKIALGDADGVCDSKEVQIFMSNYSQWSLVISQTSAIFALANIGTLSEKYGRKPFMMLIVLFVFISRMITFATFNVHDTFQFYTFLFSDLIQSMLGGLFGFQGLVNSYIADVVDPKKRVFLMGFGVGAIFAGETLGPMLSRLLLNQTPARAADLYTADPKKFSKITRLEFVPLEAELIVGFLLLMYIIFVLPESKDPTRRQQDKQTPLSYANILKPIRTLVLRAENIPAQYANRKYRLRIMVFTLVICSVISSIFSIGVGRILIQYGIYLFDWKSSDIANLISLLALSRSMVLFVVSPFICHTILVKYLHFNVSKNALDLVDMSMILIGAFFDIFFYLGIALANNTSTFLGSLVAGSLGATLSPTAQSALIKYFPESKTSEVLLGISLINGLGCVVAPLVSMSVYKFGLRHGHPGLIFVLSSVSFCGLFAMILVAKRIIRVAS